MAESIMGSIIDKLTGKEEIVTGSSDNVDELPEGADRKTFAEWLGERIYMSNFHLNTLAVDKREKEALKKKRLGQAVIILTVLLIIYLALIKKK